MITPIREPLMTTKQLSEFLQVPIQTIYDWRLRGYGPAGIKVGNSLRFRESVVYAWLDQQTEAA